MDSFIVTAFCHFPSCFDIEYLGWYPNYCTLNDLHEKTVYSARIQKEGDGYVNHTGGLLLHGQ